MVGAGRGGRIVNISYEYRRSLNETTTTLLKQVTTRKKFSDAANLALVTDIVSYGGGRFAHNIKYHFVRGDGSVDLYKDDGGSVIFRNYGLTLWQAYGLSPVVDNDAMFLVLDHPDDFANYLITAP